jgi:hypothetical protein
LAVPLERWSPAQVAALAPDAGSARAARAVGGPGHWRAAGRLDDILWGLCRGSAAHAYQVCVDLSGPAYRCSCPSRKVPCKHALGLLLLWAEGNVPTAVRPERAAAWLAARAAAALAAGPAPAAGDAGVSGDVPPGDRRPVVVEPAPAPDRAREKRADERAARVRAGLDELDRWLADQVRRGLVAPESTSRSAWEGAASRLVDAQAGALANRVRRATELLDVGPSGLGAVLGELATLHALAVAGRRPGALDADLATSVRTAVGWTVSREEVLSGTPVTDRWHVVGRSDTEEHRITVRRTWLLGERTGRWGLLLDFAAFGQTLAEDPAVGMVLHADLHHFPGRVPIRALVGVEHDPAEHDVEGPPASTVAGTLADAGWAIAREPWLERWPGVVRATPAVRSTGRGWALVDETGALALTDDRAIATLLAVSGGHPVVVAGEHRTAGFAPLAVRVRDRTAALR